MRKVKRTGKAVWSTRASIKARWQAASKVRTARARGSSVLYSWERVLCEANANSENFTYALTERDYIGGK